MDGEIRKGAVPLAVKLGAVLVTVSVALVLLTPYGNRSKWWGYGESVQLLQWSFGLGIAATLLLMIGLLLCRPGTGRRGFLPTLLALLILIPALAIPGYWGYQKSKLPPIQDIATDPDEPVEFWMAPTSRAWPGQKNADLQRAAYPGIRPLILNRPPDQVFQDAVALVKERGWRLWEPDAEEGRIEASISTFWFGFEDDVAIRVKKADGGTRIDMRSTSRFGGGGDGGTNARRIREFLDDLKQRL